MQCLLAVDLSIKVAFQPQPYRQWQMKSVFYQLAWCRALRHHLSLYRPRRLSFYPNEWNKDGYITSRLSWFDGRSALEESEDKWLFSFFLLLLFLAYSLHQLLRIILWRGFFCMIWSLIALMNLAIVLSNKMKRNGSLLWINDFCLLTSLLHGSLIWVFLRAFRLFILALLVWIAMLALIVLFPFFTIFTFFFLFCVIFFFLILRLFFIRLIAFFSLIMIRVARFL